jgi:hypothetical protein
MVNSLFRHISEQVYWKIHVCSQKVINRNLAITRHKCDLIQFSKLKWK